MRIPEIVLGFLLATALWALPSVTKRSKRLVVSLAKDSQHCWIENIERTTNELENLTHDGAIRKRTSTQLRRPLKPLFC